MFDDNYIINQISPTKSKWQCIKCGLINNGEREECDACFTINK